MSMIIFIVIKEKRVEVAICSSSRRRRSRLK